MKRVARIVATVGGIGYLPAPGTFGSLVGLLIGAPLALSHLPPAMRLAVLGLSTLIGVLTATSTERQLKTHDPSCVVVDELIGMLVITAAAPGITHSVRLLAVAFGLFRLFDVLKPPPLLWLSRFPAGWGIVLDDLGAAAYTVGVLWAVWAARAFF